MLIICYLNKPSCRFIKTEIFIKAQVSKSNFGIYTTFSLFDYYYKMYNFQLNYHNSHKHYAFITYLVYPCFNLNYFIYLFDYAYVWCFIYYT